MSLNTKPLPPLTKQVCQLDANGYYLYTTDADLDLAASDGSYILPGGCIDADPPEDRPGHAARWQDGAWQYLPDHRGQVFYSTATGQPHTINAVGALPDGITDTPPPDKYHSWDAKAKAWTLTKSARAQQLADAKAAKYAAINNAAQAHISRAAELDKVPEFELATWAQQAAEAEAWAVNNTAATPMLSQIALARGADLDDLRTKALKSPRLQRAGGACGRAAAGVC
ncbi:tail fiber assembly protein [Paralysiella testudinis]|uniref:tail fiber assembly protein n=1 Tax=Paralysiella testudinis TaxID=2809020 RepID=UPI001E2C1861|nr:tail fiber assembly protein [Paralysiella testudinis]